MEPAGASDSRKRTVTREAFERFLSVLDPNAEAAGQIYVQISSKLGSFFRHRGSTRADELVDETIDRVVSRSEDIEVRSLMPFVLGVARRVASESHRRTKPVDSIDELPPHVWDRGFSNEPPSAASAQLMGCLEDCIRSLPQNEQRLIRDYYHFERGEKASRRLELGREFGLAPNTLRVRAARIRHKLQQCVEKCRR